jgi:hypothetical protein
MYAFGDGLLFLAVFGAVAIVPTGAALIFLRPYRPLWIGLSIAALVLAVTAPLGVLVCVAESHGLLSRSCWDLFAAVCVFRVLGSPLFTAAGMLVSAIIAPGRASRAALLAATGMECIAGVYAVVHWYAGCCYI